MKKYDNKSIEKKWREKWDESGIYKAEEKSEREKFYALIEFPYPSGDGLHVGHVRSNTAMDIIARKRRMEGKNVLYPIGWDAFGLPTENYAIKTKTHPKDVTKKNTDRFRTQLKALGFSFDWSREVNTTDPEYYKWTQWIFLQFYKQGLAYKTKSVINWCLSCKIGLANEEVVDGKCERCGGETEKREKEQWMLKITKYAERLLEDLDTVDYVEKIKIQQRNWIGKSAGAELLFRIESDASKELYDDCNISVFTTRADTLYGVTFLAVAPEHIFLQNNEQSIQNIEDIKEYVRKVKGKSEMERTAEGKEKTGVKVEGVVAINPANGERVPIFVADYVLPQYGTGAVMGVPAHDERDFEFANKHKLPIKMVICPNYPEPKCPVLTNAYTGDGCLVGSEKFDGMENEEAKKAISEHVGGKTVVTYKLRDWIFSRQRYWGEPIPLIFCKKCGFVPVPEHDLPVLLPEVDSYTPTDSGESPLANILEWVNVSCPTCGEEATRETDTMPNWAGSSWYFLRYADPHNKEQFASKESLNYWTPVDWYNGGMEHTTLHLLYSRFWHKFLFDLGLVPTSEPYAKRTSHGLILAENGEKMSKSKGNVVNPDDIVLRYGADTLRLYEMFMGPFDQAVSWNTEGLMGPRRFLEKVWKLQEKVGGQHEPRTPLTRNLHQTIKKVSEDIESMKFNTAVSALMVFVHELEKEEEIQKNMYEKLLILLAPYAPFITEEIWEQLGNTTSIHLAPWVLYEEEKLKAGTRIIVFQVNGKTRGTREVSVDLSKGSTISLGRGVVDKWLPGGKETRVIFVEGRLVNFVT